MDTTLEVLHVALEFEKKGMEYYREAAGRVSDKVIKSVLLSLAEDEEAHQSIIRRYYQAIEVGQSSPPDSQQEMSVSKTASERIEAAVSQALSSIGADATYQEVYKTATEFEKMSYDYYSTHHSDNPRVNAFFKYLAGVERIHQEMLQLMLEPG